jgi:branched-chain amino acid transport system substrate-binding protein
MKAKNGGAQAIVMWGFGAEPALIAKQVRSLNIDAQLVGGGGIDNVEAYVKPAGAAANNTLLVGWQLTPNNPNATAFDAEYQKRYKAKPDILSYECYDWVKMCAEALKTSGNDKTKFIQAVRDASKTYEGFYGKYNLDDKGDNKISVAILKWVNGERTFVKSYDITNK